MGMTHGIMPERKKPGDYALGGGEGIWNENFAGTQTSSGKMMAEAITGYSGKLFWKNQSCITTFTDGLREELFLAECSSKCLVRKENRDVSLTSLRQV